MPVGGCGMVQDARQAVDPTDLGDLERDDGELREAQSASPATEGRAFT